MNPTRILAILFLVAIIPGVCAETITESIVVDNTYWTAPEGVTMVDLVVVGAGGSGSGGGYAYNYVAPFTPPFVYNLSFSGSGGFAGTKSEYTDIRVTPGESYLVRIGMPGATDNGHLQACTMDSYHSLPGASTTTYNGGTSYITIDGSAYSGNGGKTGNTTVHCQVGVPPSISAMYPSTPSWSSNGQAGYVIADTLALSGTSTVYGAGGSPGTGYGAGGGGGGKGGTETDTVFGGAAGGGAGAQGIIQVTYDTAAIPQWYPAGYITNVSGIGIPTASVEIIQYSKSQTVTTDANGYYSTTNGNFLKTVPANITVTKTGYTTESKRITPLDIDGMVNATLIDPNDVAFCDPSTCIYGLVEDAWLNAPIAGATVELIENVTRANYQTNTTTSGGFYNFVGLTDSTIYDVWSSKTGYENSTVTQATTGAGVNNRHDLNMAEYHTLSVVFVDAETGGIIPTVSVRDSYGYSETTTTGIYSHSYPYSPVALSYSANGYLASSKAYSMIDDIADTIELTSTSRLDVQAYTPESVMFHIRSIFGAPISNATVTIQATETSAEDWNILEQLLGYPLSSVPIQEDPMTGVSDDQGNIEFIIMKNTKYTISATHNDYTFTTIEVYSPTNPYTLFADVGSGESWWGNSDVNPDLDTIVEVTKSKINSTHGFINISYTDPNVATVGGHIYITTQNSTRGGADVIIDSIPIPSSAFDASSVVPIDAITGTDYKVEVWAETSV